MNIEQNNNRAVPNDEIAKLSFYLENIGGCIPGAIDVAYTQYRHFASFSQEMKEAIVKICEIMEPSILENYAMKQVNQCDLGSTDSNCENAFITLTDRINHPIVNNNNHEQVAGLNLTNRQITKMMIYTERWITNYYTTPLQKMKQKLARNNNNNQQNLLRAQNLLPLPSNRQDQYILLNPDESLIPSNSVVPNGNRGREYSRLDYFGIFLLISVFGVLGFFYTLFFLRKCFPTKKLLFLVLVSGLALNTLAIYELVELGLIDFGGLLGKVRSVMR